MNKTVNLVSEYHTISGLVPELYKYDE